jgi:hypothetical protein
MATFAVVRNAEVVARRLGGYACGLFLVLPKAINKMKTIRLDERKPLRFRRWFQRRRRAVHDPMLALSMSIFNGERNWGSIFNPAPERENVWG